MYLLKKVDLELLNVFKKLMLDTYKQAYIGMHTKENIENYCNKNFTEENIKNILSSDIYTCIVAFKEDLPVGFFILKEKSCPVEVDGFSIELQQLYILKSEYNKGLGKLLFSSIIDILKKNSVQFLWLYVSNTNERAISFYKKIGFEIIGIGKELIVGTDILSSSIMTYKV